MIPALIQFTYNSSRICSEENNAKIHMLNIIIIIYIIFTFVFATLYALFLYLTNSNMEEGLIKMSRIDPVLIQETIKTIKMFNKSILSKYAGKNDKDKKELNGTELSNASKNKELNDEKNDDNEETVGYYDPSLHKKLNILSYSYYQSIFLIIIFGAFIIPIYLETRIFVKNENNFFLAKDYFIDDLIKTSLNILNLKMILINSTITDYLNFTNSAKEKYKGQVSIQVSKYKSFSHFYQKKYILNICPILFQDNSDEYFSCKNDSKIGEYCNVEGLIKLIEDNIYTIEENYKLKKQYLSDYNSYIEFSSEEFKRIEYLQMFYLSKLPNKFIEIFHQSEVEFSQLMKKLIIIIDIFMIIILWIYCLYIIIIYIQKIIHLLLISRCVFKIIPTRVINQTKELEDWIDDKY